MKIDIDLNKLTIEELEQFLGLAKKGEEVESEPKIAPKVEQKVIVVQPRKKYKGRSINKKLWEQRFKDIQSLIDSGVSSSKAMQKVVGYTLQGKVRKKFNKFLKKKTDKRVIFMKFINERSKKYTAQGYENSEARKLASEDYRKEVKKEKPKKDEYMIKSKPKVPESPTEARLRLARQMAKPKVVTEFPIFKTVLEVYQPILQSVVRNMLELRGTKITYASEGVLLDIGKDDWKEFLGEFFNNSGDISLFFKVPNNFKIKYNEIVYI